MEKRCVSGLFVEKKFRRFLIGTFILKLNKVIWINVNKFRLLSLVND